MHLPGGHLRSNDDVEVDVGDLPARVLKSWNDSIFGHAASSARTCSTVSCSRLLSMTTPKPSRTMWMLE